MTAPSDAAAEPAQTAAADEAVKTADTTAGSEGIAGIEGAESIESIESIESSESAGATTTSTATTPQPEAAAATAPETQSGDQTNASGDASAQGTASEPESESAPDASGTASTISTDASDADNTTGNTETGKNEESAPANEPPPFDLAATEKALADLLAKADQIGFKNTGNLSSARKALNKLKLSIPEAEVTLLASAAKCQQLFDDALSKNRQHQEQLQEKTAALLTSLKEALSAGQSEAALPTWDKIQGNISNTSGKIRSALQESANEFKTQINELRDWKIFAATEKKKTLVQQMQQLAENASAEALDPAAQSKAISQMHSEWKALGRSNDNETLWKEFKTWSDKAYEPCKDYFKQRKQQMAANLQQRKVICSELEKQLADIDPATVKVAELSQLLNQADKDWKQYAPVEQSKIKALQKRYYGLLNQIRKIRKKIIRDNAAGKRALIEQAQSLVALEDHREAMEQAKKLQQEWKQFGPTTYKDDKKLWEEFRAACDQIFDKRKQESAQLQNQLQAAEAELQKVIDKVSALAALTDDELRKVRNEYQTAAQEFTAALHPKLRKTKARWLDRFNDLKRQLDARYQALPDKKQQAVQEATAARIALLQPLESALLAASSDADIKQAVAAYDQSIWQAGEKIGDAELDKTLESRLQALLTLHAVADLQSLLTQQERSYRDLCIEAEIKAGAETPAEDQQQRMQKQLEQLQQGFGQQQQATRKELQQFVVNTRLLADCIGPLQTATREALQARLATALGKIR